jgi:sugar-specific transcriptional regulator TrmB
MRVWKLENSDNDIVLFEKKEDALRSVERAYDNLLYEPFEIKEQIEDTFNSIVKVIVPSSGTISEFKLNQIYTYDRPVPIIPKLNGRY